MIIGQTLFVVFNRNRRAASNEELPITKIGRKWLTLGDGYGAIRVDKETLWIDGGGYASPGKGYLSRKDWEDETALSDAWNRLRQAICHEYLPPLGVTVERIQQARELLGLLP